MKSPKISGFNYCLIKTAMRLLIRFAFKRVRGFVLELQLIKKENNENVILIMHLII
jgi:hypothetical protein